MTLNSGAVRWKRLDTDAGIMRWSALDVNSTISSKLSISGWSSPRTFLVRCISIGAIVLIAALLRRLATSMPNSLAVLKNHAPSCVSQPFPSRSLTSSAVISSSDRITSPPVVRGAHFVGEDAGAVEGDVGADVEGVVAFAPGVLPGAGAGSLTEYTFHFPSTSTRVNFLVSEEPPFPNTTATSLPGNLTEFFASSLSRADFSFLCCSSAAAVMAASSAWYWALSVLTFDWARLTLGCICQILFCSA